MFFKKSANPN